MPASRNPASKGIELAITAIFFFSAPGLIAAQTPSGSQFHASGVRLALGEQLGIQRIAVDSSGQQAPQVADTVSGAHERKSPLAAVLFSLIPGGGQIYDGSYWKVPIVWGLQGFFVYEWIANNKVYQGYRQETTDSIAVNGPVTSSDPNVLTIPTLIGLRNAAQDQRDSYAWYIAGTYLLSMLDAYVDAELSGFDVSPNLGVVQSHTVVAVNFSMRF